MHVELAYTTIIRMSFLILHLQPTTLYLVWALMISQVGFLMDEVLFQLLSMYVSLI